MRRIPEAMHEEMAALFLSGASQSEIAEKYGYSIHQIATVMQKCGIKLTREQCLERARARSTRALRIRIPKLPPDVENRPYRIRDAAIAAAAVTGISLDTLIFGRRKKRNCRVRAAVYHLCAPYNSYEAIARVFGGRDHSTVINGCDIAAGLMAQSQDFRELVAAIDQRARADVARRVSAVSADLERLAA